MKSKDIIKGIKGLTKVALKIDRVPEEISNQRKGICSNCEYKIYTSANILGRNLNVAKCSVCRCYINAKTLLTTEECPKGKWKMFISEKTNMENK